MQQTDPTYAPLPGLQPVRRRSRVRRFVALYYVIFAILLIALLPPYISINRFQRRIALSIGQSLGRPVHLDKVTLDLLPAPGFILQNLVVSEDPAFGNEPVIRANSVRATLRILPLWRHKVEFSTISFTEPSVNLVHLPDGKWNLESILIQASHLQAAPTSQKTAGGSPRFPYIEATGARVNLKLGPEKLPFSLTDAEFALWLANPQEWHLRVDARPARTDTSASDTGTLRLEGTLGRAASLTQVPISLDAEWRTVPLGEATRVLFGRDAGVRGEMTLSAHAQGTIGDSALTTHLRLNALRRDDFVPDHPLNIDLTCETTATSSFHSFQAVNCVWPAGAPILLTASIPDVRSLDSASAKVNAENIPASTTLDWLRIASTRVPPDLSAQGTVTAHLQARSGVTTLSNWTAGLQTKDLTLTSPNSGLAPMALGPLSLQSDSKSSAATGPARKPRTRPPPTIDLIPGLLMTAHAMPLGGKDPASLEAHVDTKGYVLHLSGMAVLSRLLALGKAIPQFGDGLKEALPAEGIPDTVRLDLTANRSWGALQTWQPTINHPPVPSHRTHRTHRNRR